MICHRNLPLWGSVSLPSKPAWGSYNLRHCAKKSVWRLGNNCTPIWHSTQEGCLMIGRGLTSSTLLLGSESAQIKRICTDLCEFYKQLLTKHERSYGCSTAATLLSPAHRLGFECQPANFLAPHSFFFFFTVSCRYQKSATPQPAAVAVRCEVTIAPKRSKKGRVGSNEELARAGVFCSESHGRLAWKHSGPLWWLTARRGCWSVLDKHWAAERLARKRFTAAAGSSFNKAGRTEITTWTYITAQR